MRRILLDNNIDQRFAALLPGHVVTHVREIGWAKLTNRLLLKAADEEGFEVLITGDKQMRYQQSLQGRNVTVITLASRYVDYRGIAPLASLVLEILEDLDPGQFIVVTPPEP